MDVGVRTGAPGSRGNDMEGTDRREADPGYRQGETSEGGKPMSVTSTKQGWKGPGWSEASRG